jgi:hypothetical protein
MYVGGVVGKEVWALLTLGHVGAYVG